MPRLTPAGFRPWSDISVHTFAANASIQSRYEAGYSGILYDPESSERLRDVAKRTGGSETFEDAADANGLVNAGAGSLSCPFIATLEIWPEAFPGDPQLEGSCVGHNGKNSGMGTLAAEIASGLADAVTGVIEGPPDVSAEGEASGVFSICGIYPFRGYSGHGWDCGSCAEVMVTDGGLLVARNYPEWSIDLTNVTSKTENLTPSKMSALMRAACPEHQFRTCASASAPEAIRDALAVGICLGSCGGEGFSSTLNEHGVAKRSGSWSHAMAILACDDREWAKSTYGGPLFLVQNSWGRWQNSGGSRDIHDSAQYVPASKKAEWIAKGIVNATTGNIMIPVGSFWARWSDIRNRDYYAMGGAKGWKRKKFLSWGGSLAG